MFCVQYVNDHSRKFLSAYEEHYIFSLSVLKICMRLLRFLRHFALNCLNCLTFLTRTLNLIMSLLFPTFVLFPISACSFFALLVPFGPSLYKFCLSNLCFLVYFLYKLVSFLSTLYLFYPKPLSKKTQPSVSITLIRVGRNCIIYFCSYLVVSFFLI